MNRLRYVFPLALAAASSAALLSGCSNPPALLRPDPVIIEPHQTIDRVHNRDASVEFYSENRGGAAVRKDEAAHVLFNEHYEADAEALKQKRNAEMAAKAAQDAAVKAAEEAARKKEISRLLNMAIEAHKKDKSVYGQKEAQAIRSVVRDQSIYQKAGTAQKVQDRSVYARPAAAKPATSAKESHKAKAGVSLPASKGESHTANSKAE